MTTTSTSSPAGAREHARAMGGTIVDTMPWVPAADAPWWAHDELPVDPVDRLHAETVAAGGYTSLHLPRGATVELTDLLGDGCAHVALFHAGQTDERLNVADTVKIQWQAYLGPGAMLLSDRGRVLATVAHDTSGRHDAFAGTTTVAALRERGHDGSAHSGTPAGRPLLVLAAAKHDLAPRDLPPTVSFFQGVRVEEDGSATFRGSAGAGTTVRLRAELPLVLLLANVPHPLDTRPGYPSTPVRVRAWRSSPDGLAPGERQTTPEAARAYARTDDHARTRGL